MARETLADVKAHRDELRLELQIEREKRLRLEALVDMVYTLVARARGDA